VLSPCLAAVPFRWYQSIGTGTELQPSDPPALVPTDKEKIDKETRKPGKSKQRREDKNSDREETSVFSLPFLISWFPGFLIDSLS
jgi:hypothetical protein